MVKVYMAYFTKGERVLVLPMYDVPNALEKLKRQRSYPASAMIEAKQVVP